MTTIHTIFGAGQIGTQLARILAAKGQEVRLVRRSAPGAAMPKVTWMQGDVTNQAFAAAACRGATTVYNTTNPPDYHRWDGVLQPLFRSVRWAAAKADARLVQLDNLYMYGRPDRVPFDESTPRRPCTEMGRLRAELTQELFDAHTRGEVRMSIGHASDFFGPNTPNAAVIRPDTLAAVARGGSAFVFGNPDIPHSYSYSPDVARGLAVLGTHPAAEGRAWHLPVAAQLTTRELFDRFASRVGTRVKVRRIPNWILRWAGTVIPLMAAIATMNYQWDIPYVVDDGDFRRTFGVGPTDLDEAIDHTMEAFVTTAPEGRSASDRADLAWLEGAKNE